MVVGASVGMGRGVARQLGRAGATVYCVGPRGTGTRSTAYAAGRVASVEETAALVSREGGDGIAVHLDPGVNARVAELFVRVRRDHGRLDILVNGFGWRSSGVPIGRFWTYTRQEAGTLSRVVRSHVTTCLHAASLMSERQSGLIVELCPSQAPFDPALLFSDLGRVVQIRLAAAVAKELEPFGVAALALTPGQLPTDALEREASGVRAYGTATAPDVLASETGDLVGRAVVALAGDPRVGRKSGGLYGTWALAREYGLTDDDRGRSSPGRISDEYRACGRVGAAQWLA